MSYIERRNESRPVSGEAPFGLDEVFFSRTDSRGVIESADYVFRRLADFEWPDLLGAPHRILRHPDMPRALFWLLWHRLRQGLPTGLYVKNRARDGLFYWVFAVVAPVDGGYLSARIKPTSPLLAEIAREYAGLRARERSEDLPPETGAGLFLDRLQALGFPDYERFAAHALGEELLARDRGRSLPDDPRICALRKMLAAAERLQSDTAALADEFHAMRTIPHNMRVIAARLEPTGGPVSTLSKNYGAVSREMSDWFTRNVVGTGATFTRIHGTVNSSLFLEGLARILGECDQQLWKERRRLGDLDIGREREILSREAARYCDKSRRGLARVRDEAERIFRACETMQRQVLGLSSTRVLCKIESARTAEAAEALSGIIEQLGTFQERISARLDRIAGESEAILSLTA